MNNLEELHFFSTPVYAIEIPEFLDSVRQVASDPLYHQHNLVDADGSLKMSSTFFDDERIKDFSINVIQTSWDILKRQGYMMSNYQTIFESMWLQTHDKHSYMPQHTHANGNQIVGFYFTELPKDGCKLIFHDPRIAKTQIDLDEADPSQITVATKLVTMQPKEGTLVLTNAWLAHSFSANLSDENVKFVHINIGTQRIANNQLEKPEII